MDSQGSYSANPATLTRPVSAVTWNIQRADRGWPFAAPWATRRRGIVGTLRRLQPDIAGLQEVLAAVIPDVRSALPNHGFLGVGRTDGRRSGEFAPILYDRRRWQLIEQGHFWLSQTPGMPSRGWDAALPRLATWARLLEPSCCLFVLNTHLDHVGRRARHEAAEMILRESVRLSRGDPVLILGDLNARSSEPPLRTLATLFRNVLADSLVARRGPTATHWRGRIDHVLYSRQLRARASAVVQRPDLSDHAALICRFTVDYAHQRWA